MSGQASLPAAPLERLHDELRDLITDSRQRLATTVNSELTLLYWHIGQRLANEVLGGARAQYGAQLMSGLGKRLAQEFGRGFEAKNLRRMVQFAQVFPDKTIVATLSRQLSWSHVVALLPLKTTEARNHYAGQAAQERWTVRELRHHIERKAFERSLIASAQASEASVLVEGSALPITGDSPTLLFKDPYFLDFLGLGQAYDEAPIGLILCAESSREQVELLEMHKDGITVAEYWTELPPKAELERHLHMALVEARERLARRNVLLTGHDDA